MLLQPSSSQTVFVKIALNKIMLNLNEFGYQSLLVVVVLVKVTENGKLLCVVLQMSALIQMALP